MLRCFTGSLLSKSRSLPQANSRNLPMMNGIFSRNVPQESWPMFLGNQKNLDQWILGRSSHLVSWLYPQLFQWDFCRIHPPITRVIASLHTIRGMIHEELVGGFNPSEKYESQLRWLFPIYGKIKMFQSTPTREGWNLTKHPWKSGLGLHHLAVLVHDAVRNWAAMGDCWKSYGIISGQEVQNVDQIRAECR